MLGEQVDKVRSVGTSYEPVRSGDAAEFAAFLVSEPWPFHSGGVVDAAEVARRVAAGAYFNHSVRTHWIVVGGRPCGFVRAFDLDDGTPLFDVRLAGDCRGRGVGRAAVGWLVGDVFGLLPEITRIEGTTRADNLAMRAVFRACGFVKEAHYREAWPGSDGGLHDTIGYGILRRDWLSGSTTPVDWAG